MFSLQVRLKQKLKMRIIVEIKISSKHHLMASIYSATEKCLC